MSQAKAGADMVAPSGMMDGFVTASREALDEAGYSHVGIMAYSAKYASCFYGPFRQAAGTASGFGHRKSYQMDPANSNEAIREAGLDEGEGARRADGQAGACVPGCNCKAQSGIRLADCRLQRLGEYAMLKAAVEKGLLGEEQAVLEVLTSIKRAGADIILSYHAKDAARWLAKSSALASNPIHCAGKTATITNHTMLGDSREDV